MTEERNILVNTHALKANIMFINVYGAKNLFLAVFTGNRTVIPINVMYNRKVPINDVINGSSLGSLISPEANFPNLKSSFGGCFVNKHTIRPNTEANKKT